MARSAAERTAQGHAGEPVARRTAQDSDTAAPSGGAARFPIAADPRPDHGRAAIAPAHTDWLLHHLVVEGPADALAAFRATAAGAGIIPWHLDLDRVEEDVFLRLAAPQGQARTLSLDGARLLAAELRDAVARRHARAVAQAGRSQACCFDLHALVPVPEAILRLEPDHPESLLWLWTQWGTTEALRHVARAPDPNGGAPATAATVFRVSFWSADWTPWRALATVQARFPALRFEVQPRYELV
jgi:hypothetical protein